MGSITCHKSIHTGLDRCSKHWRVLNMHHLAGRKALDHAWIRFLNVGDRMEQMFKHRERVGTF